MNLLTLIRFTLAAILGAVLLTLPTQAASPDIVVYSGLSCGIVACITAAREGAKVVLIEPTKRVGGLSTSGINTTGKF